MERIKAIVNVVFAVTTMNMVCAEKEQRRLFYQIFECKSGWTLELIDVNCFYITKGDVYRTQIAFDDTDHELFTLEFSTEVG